MLVDTGATVTVLRKDIFENLFSKPELKGVKSSLVNATGELSPFYGKASLKLNIGGNPYEHDIMVASIQNEGILGIDFLKAYRCNIMISKGYLTLNGRKVPCFSLSDETQNYCCKISICEDVEIPPETEMIIPCLPIGNVQNDEAGVVEAHTNFIEKSGLLVAKSLISMKNEIVPLRVINLNTESKKVYRDTIVATIEPVNETEVEKINSINVVENEKKDELPDHMTELFERSCENLDEEQKIVLKQLLMKYPDVFSKSKSDLGLTNLVEHKIDTGDAKPIKQRPYRIPLSKREQAEKEIKSMAENGIIEPSYGPWSSPIVMVAKKDGSVRFCCDYRKINMVTIKDSQPLPRVDDTFDALNFSSWYSTVDMRQGFWQVRVAECDRPKTAFSIPGSGLWQFVCMPFGLANSPQTFERLVEKVLSGLSWKICLVYLDDIIIFSKTFEEHISNLDQVLQRLREANLKLSPKKCTLLQSQVTFLGHVVSKDGIATDPEKIRSVTEWPVPKNVKQVRSFLGLCSYYRRYVKHFSNLARPLHRLTELDRQFVWNEECQKAFESLKLALTTAPILGYPSSDGPFVLDCDASNEGVGAVLSQVQDDQEKVIGYFSKTLSRPKRHYCVTRKELLAVVLSILHFHHYLYGRKFKVRSDHGALKWLMNFKVAEGQIARWLQLLGTYDFEIEHRAGRIHNNADALSRRPCSGQVCPYCERQENKPGEKGSEIDKGSSPERKACASPGPGLLKELKGGMVVLPGKAVNNLESSVGGPLDATGKFNSSQKQKVASLAIKSEPFDGDFQDLESSVGGSLDATGRTDSPSGQSLHTGVTFSDVKDTEVVVSFPELGVCYPMEVASGNNTSRHPVEGSVYISEPSVRYPMEAIGENSIPDFEGTHSLDTSVCCPMEATGKHETCCEVIEKNSRTESNLKVEIGEEIANDKYSVGVVTTRYQKRKMSENESNEGSKVERIPKLQDNILYEHQSKDPNLKILIDLMVKGVKPEWNDISSFSPCVKFYWNRWDQILSKKFESDRGDKVCSQIIIPQSLVPVVLEQLHDSVTGGHLGVKKTFNKIREKYHWYRMYRDVERWCQKCDICNSRKMSQRRAKAPMKIYNVGAPLERVAVDIMGPLPITKMGNRYLLVIGDYFTKWVEAIPLKNQEANAVASELVDKFVSIFGVPIQIHSDQGTNFESCVFQEMCTILGIEKTRTTVMYPQSDGMVERSNRTLENMLACFVSKHQRDWDEFIPLLLMAYRSSEHESTKVSPNKMMFGREINLPIDLLLGKPEKEIVNNATEFAYDLEDKLEKIHEFARENLNLSSERIKRYYDKNVNTNSYEKGEKVWYYKPQRKSGLNPKLQRPWIGPVKIVDKINDVLYRIRLVPNGAPKVVHHNKLKPYLGDK